MMANDEIDFSIEGARLMPDAPIDPYIITTVGKVDFMHIHNLLEAGWRPDGPRDVRKLFRARISKGFWGERRQGGLSTIGDQLYQRTVTLGWAAIGVPTDVLPAMRAVDAADAALVAECVISRNYDRLIGWHAYNKDQPKNTIAEPACTLFVDENLHFERPRVVLEPQHYADDDSASSAELLRVGLPLTNDDLRKAEGSVMEALRIEKTVREGWMTVAYRWANNVDRWNEWPAIGGSK